MSNGTEPEPKQTLLTGGTAPVATWLVDCPNPECGLCEECEGTGRVECSNCNGQKDCVCSCCDAEHDCGQCDGTGTQECDECRTKVGTKQVPHRQRDYDEEDKIKNIDERNDPKNRKWKTIYKTEDVYKSTGRIGCDQCNQGRADSRTLRT